jgi:hypothetical protein
LSKCAGRCAIAISSTAKAISASASLSRNEDTLLVIPEPSVIARPSTPGLAVAGGR